MLGVGDPAAEDARFIGMRNNRLGLWLGRAQSAAGFVAGNQALSEAKWHLAAAVSDGDHVILNGAKIFTTHGADADFLVVWVRFGDDRSALGAVVVERGTPGFTID